MGYIKKVFWLSIGVAAGLLVVNFVVSRFAPQFKGYLGLS